MFLGLVLTGTILWLVWCVPMDSMNRAQADEIPAKQTEEDAKKKLEKALLEKDVELKKAQVELAKTKEELAKTKIELQNKIALIDKNSQTMLKQFEDAIAKIEVDQNKLNKLAMENDNLVAKLQRAQEAREKANKRNRLPNPP
jgi:hypothetical protein